MKNRTSLIAAAALLISLWPSDGFSRRILKHGVDPYTNIEVNVVGENGLQSRETVNFYNPINCLEQWGGQFYPLGEATKISRIESSRSDISVRASFRATPHPVTIL